MSDELVVVESLARARARGNDESELDEWQAPVQSTSDEQTIALWLHGHPESTRSAYRKNVDDLLEFAGVGIRRVTLAHLQEYQDSLIGKPRTNSWRLAVIKSLLSFAHDLGYIPFNPGRALRPVQIKNDLAERIAPEGRIIYLIESQTDPRNYALFLFLYHVGGRVSEVADVKWKDIRETTKGAVVTLFGKRGKTLHVNLSPRDYEKLTALRPAEWTGETYVFRSTRGGGRMSRQAIWYIAKSRGKAAGLPAISPHWFRHAHASHSLANGANLALVMATLGHSSPTVTGVYLHVDPAESSGGFLKG